MSSILEKNDGTIVATVRITLKPDRDDFLIKILRATPRGKLAHIIRECMRNGTSTFHDLDDVSSEKSINLSELGGEL